MPKTFGLPSFCIAIQSVVVVGAEEKMPRIAARTIVATVEGERLLAGDSEAGQKEGETVRPESLSVQIKNSVTISRSGQPRPALIRAALCDL